VGGDVVDHLLFQFLISPSVPEIFAIKVWSCPKSCRILDVLPSEILGGTPPPRKKLYPSYHASTAARYVKSYRCAYAKFWANFLMFIIKNCWRDPVPIGVCASKPWSFSSACKNIRKQHPLKSLFGCVGSHISNFVVSGPKFTGLFFVNAGGIAVNTLVFRFCISLSVPKTFAVELWSCPKSHRILLVFGPRFFREGPTKFWNLRYKVKH